MTQSRLEMLSKQNSFFMCCDAFFTQKIYALHWFFLCFGFLET